MHHLTMWTWTKITKGGGGGGRGGRCHLVNLHFADIQSEEVGSLFRVTLEKTLLGMRPGSLLPSSLDSEF